jgi:hypothetical protein
MPPCIKFSIAVLARTLGLVAEHFAQWLFHQVSEGAEYGLGFLDDVWEFGQALLRMLAEQFGGRSRRRYDEYGDDLHPGLYTN